MNGQTYRAFSLQPRDASHRRYEALRSVFLDERPLPEVVRCHGISYGTLRNWPRRRPG